MSNRGSREGQKENKGRRPLTLTNYKKKLVGLRLIIEHTGVDGWSYSLEASERITAFRARAFYRLPIEEPVGALDGQTGIGQVAGEGGRGLVGDQRRISIDVRGFK